MKNTFKSFVIVGLMSMLACDPVNTDILVGGDGDADLSGRQFANIDPPTSIPFLFQQTTSVSIDMNKFESEGTTIESVEITKVLRIEDADNIDTLTTPVNSDPVTYIVTGDNFTQSIDELFEDVPINGFVYTEDSLSPGDSWLFTYLVNISGNSPSSDNTLTIAVSTEVPFSCPSDIPTTGTWTGETQNGAFGVFSTNEEVVVSKVNDLGDYALSDITGGFYAAFGFARDNPGNINDLCNVITVTGAPDAQFAVGNTGSVPGSWDATTET